MIKVVVIGSGNVAQHLIRAFNNSANAEVVQAFARKPSALFHLLDKEKITDDYSQILPADIYIISVSDNAIAEVSASLPFSGRFVVHTSGSTGMEHLNSKNRRGVFYSLQTFSKDKAVDLSTIPICLESEGESDYNLLQELAEGISGSVHNISSVQRQALHVAAVFVSNFTNYMYTLGSTICADNAISFDILKPLILETADKIRYLEPVAAQTGPAVRNDSKTIERHLDFLSDKNQQEIYKLLTQSIQNSNVKKL